MVDDPSNEIADLKARLAALEKSVGSTEAAVEDGEVESGEIHPESDLTSLLVPEMTIPEKMKLNWSDTWPHPWRRYFARMLDAALIGSVISFFAGIAAFLISPDTANSFIAFVSDSGGRLVFGVVLLFFSCIVTGAILGLSGTTPGKWLFGVKVLRDGKPLGIGAGIKRDLKVWAVGMCVGIPLFAIFTMWGSRRTLLAKRSTDWDTDMHANVFHRKEGFQTILWGGVGFVLFILLVALNALPSA